jgi:hypothetical protein
VDREGLEVPVPAVAVPAVLLVLIAHAAEGNRRTGPAGPDAAVMSLARGPRRP